MIDRYMELLQNTPRPADAARIGTVTVDFLVRYQHQSYAELIEVYPLQFDLLNVGVVLIPYFAGEQGRIGHYTFIAVYPGRHVVHQYNSISGVGDANFDVVLNLLQDHARAINQPFRRAEWTCENRASPQQRNGYDCGVFTASLLDMHQRLLMTQS
uniref:Ubiquitin-like protease family profile domain-containing protein n=1 Tax=Ditylenchus dipsaci TaxID=166011 RepID=A0A915DYV2_9BILA